MLGDTEVGDAFDVWPENEWPLRVFLRMQRCWRIGALGGYIGLDWPTIESRMRLFKIKATEELILQLDLMEIAALPILNAAND